MTRKLPLLLILLVAPLALAAVAAIDVVRLPALFKSTVEINGATTFGATGTAMSDSYAGTYTIDFAGVTDACEDSSGQTLTGAAVNDVCVVGPPATMPHANAWLTCYVSAADTVKVRLCGHGATGNPASASFAVRVFDP